MNIILNNVSKTIQGATVIDDISLELHSGYVYGLCGYNGCGKTMLMRLICGLISPSGGEITIDGDVLGKRFDYAPNTGLLIETPAFLKEYSGYKNLKILADMKRKVSDEDITDALLRVGLQPDKKKVRKYSLGMKQRLGIAAALLEKPELLILDEPTNALDANGVEILSGIIPEEKARGALVLLSCHDSAFLKQVSDIVFYMDNGKITEREILRENSH